MTMVLIKTNKVSERLMFVLDWLFINRLKINYKLVTVLPDNSDAPQIVYGEVNKQGIHIPDAGLLWEKNIFPQDLSTDKWHDTHILFALKDDVNDIIPFDLFSAIFYLLSRYEEYLPHTKDKYERYPAIESILYRLGCLETPIIDVWIQLFKNILTNKFGISLPPAQFKFIPTYDIDIAWSYRHKGLKRTTGALIRNVLRHEVNDIGERIGVLTRFIKDPYDSFDFLERCHHPNGLKPIFFILSALKTTYFDKNISPAHPAMKKLIEQLAEKNTIGIHPSYFSQKDEKIHKELRILNKISRQKITISRQHYLHMQLPDTYRLLISLGISADYTMGYGTHIGFRAGTSHPFPWYDLEKEQTTGLTIFPFCFMDTTAHFNQQLSAEDAFENLKTITLKLRDLDGLLITIFHNFSIGTDRRWKNWQQLYEQFLSEQGNYIQHLQKNKDTAR